MSHHRGRLAQLCESTTRWHIEIARKERLINDAKYEAIDCIIADEEYQCLDVNWEQVNKLIERNSS